MAAKLAKLQATALTLAKPRLATFMHYAKVELVPPTPGELPQAFRDLSAIIKGAQTGAWKNATVKQTLINSAITAEVLCWFFVGECIGKGHLIGYDV